MQVKNQQNWTWNKRLVPNQERSKSRLYIVTLLNVYAEYIMRNTGLDEAQAGINLLKEISISYGEGNGNPLQYSCLENPIGRGAWWATVHGVAKSRHD